MLRVAQELQGTETSFVDLSYSLSTERVIPNGQTEEQKAKQDQADDEEIVARLEATLRADTKVSLLLPPRSSLAGHQFVLTSLLTLLTRYSADLDRDSDQPHAFAGPDLAHRFGRQGPQHSSHRRQVSDKSRSENW